MTRDEIGPLFRIEGHFNWQKYLDLLNDQILPYIEDNFPDGHYYYYQDNSPIHYEHHVKDWFELESLFTNCSEPRLKVLTLIP